MALIDKFKFTRPVEVEEMEESHEVIAHPDRTVIKTDDVSAIHDMAELFSQAKLAEKDQLLCTFFFQKDCTEEEGRYMMQHLRLCQPLRDAWVWKTMRQTAPDIYKDEIQETYEMFRAMQESVTGTDYNSRRMLLGMFCILYEDPENKVDIALRTDREYEDEGTKTADVKPEKKGLTFWHWNRYIAALKEYVRCEPDVRYFLELPRKTGAEYTVSIETDGDGFRHYTIRKDSAVQRAAERGAR